MYSLTNVFHKLKMGLQHLLHHALGDHPPHAPLCLLAVEKNRCCKPHELHSVLHEKQHCIICCYTTARSKNHPWATEPAKTTHERINGLQVHCLGSRRVSGKVLLLSAHVFLILFSSCKVLSRGGNENAINLCTNRSSVSLKNLPRKSA